MVFTCLRSRCVLRASPLTFEHLMAVPEQRLQTAALPLQPVQGGRVQLVGHLYQGKAVC